MLSEYDRTIVGGNKRIVIPMADRFIWRNVADALRALATMLDVYSRMAPHADIPERLMYHAISAEIDKTNSLIREAARQGGVEMPREGRKPNSSREQGLNDAETVLAEISEKLQHIDKTRSQRGCALIYIMRSCIFARSQDIRQNSFF